MITDDNNNIIIQATPIKFWFNKETSLSSINNRGTYWTEKEFKAGIYKISASHEGLKNPSVKIHIVCVGDYNYLQHLINSAGDNSIIKLSKTFHYLKNVNYLENGVEVRNNNITIDGNGVIINAHGHAKIFNIYGDNVKLINLKIFNAKTGAVTWNGNNGLISNCTFHDNTINVYCGVAVNWNGNNGTISSCSFEGNDAYYGGAVNWKGDNGTISKSTFKDNYANTGGAIYWQGKYGKITESTLTDNKAKTGGAIYWIGDSGELRNSTLTNNKAVQSYAIHCESDNLMIINIISINNKYLNDTKLIDSMGVFGINCPRIPGAGIDIHTPKIPGAGIDITGPKIP